MSQTENRLGKRIRERRKQMKLSQAELALRVGSEQRQISLYENGGVKPAVDTIVALAQALDTTVEWLLALKGFEDGPDRELAELDDFERDAIKILRTVDFNKRSVLVEVLRVAAQLAAKP